MQVYKAYFKIIQRNLPLIIFYIVFALLLTVMIMCLGENTANMYQARINIAYINHDEGAVLADQLGETLKQYANLIAIPDDQENLQDALFFRKIKYVVRVPAGFSEGFLHGQNNVQIEKTSIEYSQSGVYLDLLINRYLSTAALYSQNLPRLNDAEITELTAQTTAQQSDLQLRTYSSTVSNMVKRYYIYLAFGMIAAIFMGVTSTMLVFNDADIRRRNLGSPLKPVYMNMQLILGNLTLGLAVWIIMVVLGFFIAGKAGFDLNSILLYANSLCLTLVCLGISSLFGSLILNRQSQSAIANLLALSLSFLSGVFVPQQLLGETVNFMASFTPTFWYVKAVNDIEKLVVFNTANLTPIINSMLIQLAFFAALLVVTVAVSRQRVRA